MSSSDRLSNFGPLVKNTRLPCEGSGGTSHRGSQTPSTHLRHPSSNEPLVTYAKGLPTQSAKRQDLLLLFVGLFSPLQQ